MIALTDQCEFCGARWPNEHGPPCSMSSDLRLEGCQWVDRATPDPCPTWADGQHCYVQERWAEKRCACGKTVERQP